MRLPGCFILVCLVFARLSIASDFSIEREVGAREAHKLKIHWLQHVLEYRPVRAEHKVELETVIKMGQGLKLKHELEFGEKLSAELTPIWHKALTPEWFFGVELELDYLASSCLRLHQVEVEPYLEYKVLRSGHRLKLRLEFPVFRVYHKEDDNLVLETVEFQVKYARKWKDLGLAVGVKLPHSLEKGQFSPSLSLALSLAF